MLPPPPAVINTDVVPSISWSPRLISPLLVPPIVDKITLPAERSPLRVILEFGPPELGLPPLLEKMRVVVGADEEASSVRLPELLFWTFTVPLPAVAPAVKSMFPLAPLRITRGPAEVL